MNHFLNSTADEERRSAVMLSEAGVQRSETPAQSKHPYAQDNCRE